jgi:hypothetical protein
MKLSISYPTLVPRDNSLPTLRALFQDLTRTLQQIAGAWNNPDSGTTSARPKAQLTVGQVYFDTTLGGPVWWNGTQWITAASVGTNIFTTLYVGGGPGVGYEFFVDGSGNLVVGNPDGTSEILIAKS